ncbi:hypothetical protein CPT_Phriendly_047 [Vibrio phage Phriendly]|nr:hypothetical protein CPT_Phriendly_047 [Vibrio phage Phriendly]
MGFFSNLMGGISEGIMNVVSYAADPFDTGYGEKIRDFGDKAKAFSENHGDKVMAAGALYGGGASLLGGGGAAAGGTGMGSGIELGSLAAPASGGMGSGAMATVGSISAPTGGMGAASGGIGALGFNTAGTIASPAASASSWKDYMTLENAEKGYDLLNQADQMTQQPQLQPQQLRSGRGAAAYMAPEQPRVEKDYGGLI